MMSCSCGSPRASQKAVLHDGRQLEVFTLLSDRSEPRCSIIERMMMQATRFWRLLAVAGLTTALCTIGPRDGSAEQTRMIAFSGADGIHKIKHIVIIMQENRSFDSYFG